MSITAATPVDPSPPVAICVTVVKSFHRDLASAISAKLADKSEAQFKKQELRVVALQAKWASFPRKEHFYARAIKALESLSSSCLQTVIQLLVNLLPGETNLNIAITPQPVNAERDLAECVVYLAVGDALANCLRHYDGSNLPALMIERLITVAFQLFRFTKARQLDEPVWTALRHEIVSQWGAVLYRLTPYKLSAIHSKFVERVDPAVKPKFEDIELCFRGMRYVRLDPSTDAGLQDAVTFIQKHLDICHAHTKTDLRKLQAEAFLVLVQQLDFTSGQYALLHPLVESIRHRGEKWAKSSDTQLIGLRLLSVVVARAPAEQFRAQAPAHVKRLLKLCSSDSTRNDALVALLDVLRGVYVPQEFGWTPGLTHARAWQCVAREDEPEPTSVERLQQIHDELFVKKMSKVADSVDQLAAIVIQMAAHNLAFFKQTLLPVLFGDRQASPDLHLVALRAIRVILEPASGFQQYAANALYNSKSVQFDKVIDDLSDDVSVIVKRMVATCVEHVGIPVIGTNPDAVEYSSFNTVHGDEDAEQQKDAVHDPAMRGVADRFLSVLKRRRDEQAHAAAESVAAKVNKTIFQWAVDSRVPAPPQHAHEPARRVARRPRLLRPEKRVFVELYKESMRVLPNAVPVESITPSTASQPAAFIGDSLVHYDEELAVLTSHALQQIMEQVPQYRDPLITCIVNMHLQSQFEDVACHKTLTGQLCGLLEMWLHALPLESRSGQAGDALTSVPTWVHRAESSALAGLCRDDPELRLMSLRLLRLVRDLHAERCKIAAASIADKQHDVRAYDVIQARELEVVQRARFRLLLQLNGGVNNFHVPTQTPDLTLAEVVQSDDESLLYLTILELSHTLTEDNCLQTLHELRQLLSQRVHTLPPAPETLKQALAEDNRKDYTPEYQTRLRLYYAMLLATSGVPEWALRTDAPIPSQSPLASLPEIAEVARTIARALWPRFLSEVDYVRDCTAAALAAVHPASAGAVMQALNEWYYQDSNSQQSAARKLFQRKIAMRHSFARVVVKLTGSTMFAKRLRDDAVFLREMQLFITETDKLLFIPDRKLAVGDLQFFIDQAVTVGNVAAALYYPRPVVTTGPLVIRYAASPVTAITAQASWSGESRQRIMQSLLTCTGFEPKGHPSSHTWSNLMRSAFYQEGIKRDAQAREQLQRFEEHLTRALNFAATAAVAHILKLGPLPLSTGEDATPADNERIKQLLNWFGNVDEQFNVFGPFLAFNFDEWMVTHCLERVYTGTPEQMLHSFHAICDVFVPRSDELPRGPARGIASDRTEYYQKLALEASGTEVVAPVPTDRDLDFAAQVDSLGAALIHLALFHLTHEAASVRLRAFEMLVRLNAALANGEGVPQLLNYRNAFKSSVVATARMNAVNVSTIMARTCSRFAEALFEQAFKLYRKIQQLGPRRWMAEALLPWSDSIRLAPNADEVAAGLQLKAHTPSQFVVLTALFCGQIAADDLPQEVMLLWQRLSLAGAREQPVEFPNLNVIVDTLSREPVTPTSVPLFRKIMLSMFRREPAATVARLVSPLSYKFFQDTHEKIRQRSVKAAEPAPAEPVEQTPVGFGAAAPAPQTPAPAAPEPAKDEKMGEKDPLLTEIERAQAMVARLLEDLVTDTLEPFIPHIPLLLHWSLLNFNNPMLAQAPQHIFTHLLSSIPLLKSAKPMAARTARLLSTLAVYARSEALTMEWAEPDGSSVDTVLLEDLSTDSGTDLSDVSQSAVDHDVKLIAPSEQNALSALRTAAVLRAALPGELAEQWGLEALQWLRCYDITLSFKSQQIYYALCVPLNRSVIHYLTRSLLRVLEEAQTRQSKRIITPYRLKGDMETESQISASARAQKVETMRKWFLLSDQANHQLSASQATHLLSAFEVIARVYFARNELHTFPSIVWTAIAGLRLTRKDYFPVYRSSLRLLNNLMYHTQLFNQFLASPMGTAQSLVPRNVIQYSSQWSPAFEGIQPLIYHGLLHKQTFHVAVSTLVFLLRFNAQTDTQIVDRPERRLFLAAVAMLPWLASELADGPKTPAADGIQNTGTSVANELSAAFAREQDNCIAIADICTRYQNGRYTPRDADTFLFEVATALADVYLPAQAASCAELLTTLFQDGLKRQRSNVVRLARHFLAHARSAAWYDAFQPFIALASEKQEVPELETPVAALLAEAARVGWARGDDIAVEDSAKPLIHVHPRQSTSLRPTISALMTIISLVESQEKPKPFEELSQVHTDAPFRPPPSWSSPRASVSGSPLQRHLSGKPVPPIVTAIQAHRQMSSGQILQRTGSVSQASSASPKLLGVAGPAVTTPSSVISDSTVSPSAVKPFELSQSPAASPAVPVLVRTGSVAQGPTLARTASVSQPQPSVPVLARTASVAQPVQPAPQQPVPPRAATDDSFDDTDDDSDGSDDSDPWGEGAVIAARSAAIAQANQVTALPQQPIVPQPTALQRQPSVAQPVVPALQRQPSVAPQPVVNTPVMAPAGSPALAHRASVGSRGPAATAASGTMRSARSVDAPSLTRLLHDAKLRPYFQRFVEDGHDQDALNFYNAVRDYTQETSVAKAALKATVIIERFVAPDSFDTVDITDDLRQDIQQNYEKALPAPPPVTLFQRAAEEIKQKLQHEVYPQFLASKEYAELVESGLL
eukprot:TRINITY_DN7305_c0_g1_i1.p1 TRINITY_DN7305_c0_g1~~TRINITY_DN7305_c0_g1_i1.p1  ORF type:complete len:2636 (-),score=706.28 TRINITY_DN7305_c0_g1_i1:81-7988(-)